MGTPSDDIRYALVETVTKDKLIHQGIFRPPSGHHSGMGVLWVHGLTGMFYRDIGLFSSLVTALDPIGVAFAAFNNRGYGMVNSIHVRDRRRKKGYRYISGGGGREEFVDSVADIEAGMSFLAARGCRKIVIAGHSTGANKAAHYLAHARDTRATGGILSSPMSDRLIQEKRPDFSATLASMKTLVRSGKGDVLMEGLSFFPMTPKRYVSLFSRGSSEDVFRYGDGDGVMPDIRRIRKPFLVILAGQDEYADRPVDTIRNAFDRSARSRLYESVVIDGTGHGYDGSEHRFSSVCAGFLKRVDAL